MLKVEWSTVSVTRGRVSVVVLALFRRDHLYASGGQVRFFNNRVPIEAGAAIIDSHRFGGVLLGLLEDERAGEFVVRPFRS